MIWVAWRRHRLMLAIVLGVYVALVIWMVFVAHTFDVAAALRGAHRCPVSPGSPRNACNGDQTQAEIIQILLLMLPAVVGVVLGAPLVASEFHSNTNRVAWTQGISRTKWFVTKWVLVASALFVGTTLFQIVANWWRPRVEEFAFFLGFSNSILDTGFGRIEPSSFAITGIAPVAYVLFAFSLGVALGALIRRTSLAIVGTLILYGGLAVIMVLFVRPNLLPQTFVPQGASQGLSSGLLQSGDSVVRQPPWFLGFGYRYHPGFNIPSGAPSASSAAQTCQDQNYSYAPYLTCLSRHEIQMGTFYQPDRHYWPLQWIEGGIYLAASLVLFGVGLVSIRRWRA